MNQAMLIAMLALAHPAIAAPPTLDLTGALPVSAQERGEWIADGGARLKSGDVGHMDVLLPNTVVMRNGRITAIVQLGSDHHLTVIARASLDGAPNADLEGLSSVGLTLQKDRVRWDRWDGGVTLPLTPSVRARASLAGKRLRIEINLDETALRGRVFDDGSGALLADVRTVDEGSGAGQVGFRVHQDTQSKALSLRIEPAPEQGETATHNPDAPLGDDRLLLLTPAQLADLPANLRAQDLGRWPYDTRGLHGLLLPAKRAQELVDAGAAVQQHPLVPFWAIDHDIRRAAGLVSRAADGSPDLSASYKTNKMVGLIFDDWVQRYPTICQKHQIGTSHRGQPIWALRISDNPNKDELEPSVLITGATHGSELLSTEYALDAGQALLRGQALGGKGAARVAGVDIWLVPLLNPDGNAVVHQITRFGGRKNGRDTTANGRADPWEGVDLNRNFPLGFGRDEAASRSFPNSAYFRGPEPLSEPESRAIAELAHRYHFTASLSFHTNGSMILAPYTLNGVENPTPNAAWSVAEALVASAPVQPNGKRLRVRKQIYPVDGTDQDWLRHSFGTVALLLEGSHHNPTSRRVRLASVAAVRPVIPTLLDQILEGPLLHIQVLDAHGKPVQARIAMTAERFRAGEQWASRESDGLYTRMVTQPGPWTVDIAADGYQSAHLTIGPANGPPRIVIMQDKP